MRLTSPIVSTQWLADHLDVSGLRVFDASVYLTVNPDGPGYITESGQGRWREAHIPGANFLEMLVDFSDNSGPSPMMMHPPGRFAELCSRHGIGDQIEIMPSDYGLDPVQGELVLVEANDVAVRRHDERAGTVVVHFPRIGYLIRKKAQVGA